MGQFDFRVLLFNFKKLTMKSNQIIFDVLSKQELEELVGKSMEEVIKNNSLTQPPSQELLTREETCKLLKIDSSTLWRWTNKGKITAYGIGNRRFYKKEELLESLVKLK